MRGSLFTSVFSTRALSGRRVVPRGALVTALFIMCCALITSRATTPAHATDGGISVDVLHKAPDAKHYLTANWMPIAVELTNTKATNLKVRLVGSRDGRFLDVVFPQGALNEEDRPLYQVEIPAPAASMTYQFIVHQPDGRLTTSKRFVIQRACIQNFKVEVAGDDSDALFRKQVGELVSKAKILERDRANYDAALKILTDLKKGGTQ